MDIKILTEDLILTNRVLTEDLFLTNRVIIEDLFLMYRIITEDLQVPINSVAYRYRADTTLITSDSILYTADYV